MDINEARLIRQKHRPPTHSGRICIECGRIFPCLPYLETYYRVAKPRNRNSAAPSKPKNKPR